MTEGELVRRSAYTWGPLKLRGVASGALALALTLACKAPAGKPPCEAPPAMQVLLQVSDVVNVGEGGESWPTTLVVYQLSGATSLDRPLDAVALEEQGEALFGDEFVDKREVVAYPKSSDTVLLRLKPNTTHLVVVAKFRETIGTAWYASMAVPAGTRDDQCAAQARGEEPVTPCLYVSLERSELAGGAFAPPGLELAAFETLCAAPSSAKKTSGKKKKELPAVPKTPKTPQTPKMPQTPQTPQAPTMPQTPKAPSAPARPSAPKLPG